MFGQKNIDGNVAGRERHSAARRSCLAKLRRARSDAPYLDGNAHIQSKAITHFVEQRADGERKKINCGVLWINDPDSREEG